MFKKLSSIENQAERRELYGLLKIFTAFFLRLVELSAMLLLACGLAWRLSGAIEARTGPYLGAPISLGLMLLVVALPRLGLLYCQSRLKADFGLDPRPSNTIFKTILAREVRLGALVWLISLILYLALVALNLWFWSLFALALGLALNFLPAWRPALLWPEKFRPLAEDELSPELLDRLDKWSLKSGLDRQSLAVETSFRPELEKPRVARLNGGDRLVIPEKALVAFPTRALNFLVASAMMEYMARAPRYFLLLRLCGLAVAIPMAAMFINISETGLGPHWGQGSPALLSLVWLAAWLSGLLTALSTHLTRRSLEIQAAAIASIVLKDDESLPLALETLAARNLEEDSPPAWREFFRPSYGRKEFLKRVSLSKHMIELEQN